MYNLNAFGLALYIVLVDPHFHFLVLIFCGESNQSVGDSVVSIMQLGSCFILSHLRSLLPLCALKL